MTQAAPTGPGAAAAGTREPPPESALAISLQHIWIILHHHSTSYHTSS